MFDLGPAGLAGQVMALSTLANSYCAKGVPAAVLMTGEVRGTTGLTHVTTSYLYTTRSPSSALLPFLGEDSPTNIDYRKQVGTPYSILSRGGTGPS